MSFHDDPKFESETVEYNLYKFKVMMQKPFEEPVEIEEVVEEDGWRAINKVDWKEKTDGKWMLDDFHLSRAMMVSDGDEFDETSTHMFSRRVEDHVDQYDEYIVEEELEEEDEQCWTRLISERSLEAAWAWTENLGLLEPRDEDDEDEDKEEGDEEDGGDEEEKEEEEEPRELTVIERMTRESRGL